MHKHRFKALPADPDHILNSGWDAVCKCGEMLEPEEMERRINAADRMSADYVALLLEVIAQVEEGNCELPNFDKQPMQDYIAERIGDR